MTTRHAQPPRDRGQTNLDFIIGIVVFLIAFTFILGFLPDLFSPYAAEEKPIVADRVEATLVDSLLAERGQPSVLNVACTANFFTGDESCAQGFDPGDSLIDRVGIGSSYGVNISIRDIPNNASQILCYDDSSNAVEPCGDSNPKLRAGSSVPQDRQSVATSRRTVLVDDRTAVVDVNVW